jgi:hypothetical protein
VVVSCEHGSDPIGSIKVDEFLDHLSDYQFLKEDSAVLCVQDVTFQKQ